MLKATDIIKLYNDINKNKMVDELYEHGLDYCIGAEAKENFFQQAINMNAEQIIDEISEALDLSDENVEPITDEFFSWLSEQSWFSNKDFEKIVIDEYLGNFVSGYRCIDGVVYNSEQLQD